VSILYLVILSLAVSLDSFGVGITYGLKRIKIPITSTIIISLASAVMILLSMQIGVWISLVLSPGFAKWIGAGILIAVGIWAIAQVLLNKYDDQEQKNIEVKNTGERIISIEIKKLGLVIQILRKPMKADIDRSGIISSAEAVLLGIALSLDAFGAGLGAALIGFQPMMTAITIAGMSGLFILFGLRVGFIFSEVKFLKKFTILPGLILILIGIIKFF